MKEITLKTDKRSYKIIVGCNILSSLTRYITKLNIGQCAYVITNPVIKKRFGQGLSKALKKGGITLKFKLMPGTEESKSLEAASSIIEDITLYDKKRRVFILAFGGGVIGDLSGFIASIYKRGIPYIQVPTTLLAQVDSSIGGKTAVDLRQGKNLVGAFYQPHLVFTDISLLKTLSLRQIRAGLAEAIKYGLIKDKRLFAYLEKRYPDILSLKEAPLKFVVSNCIKIKAGIVARDEREEKGIRTILNFGHTIGHAIEAAGGFRKYNHGEAVSLGMLVEGAISRRLGLINERDYLRIKNIIKKVGLPVNIKGVPLNKILKAHYRDKKFTGKENRFALIKGIGRARVVKNVPLKIIKKSLKERLPFASL